jgi:hypothetical protein
MRGPPASRGVTTGGPPASRGVTTGGSPASRGITIGGPPASRGVTREGSPASRGVTRGGSPASRGVTGRWPTSQQGRKYSSSAVPKSLTKAHLTARTTRGGSASQQRGCDQPAAEQGRAHVTLCEENHSCKYPYIHRKKKVREFPVPSRDVTTKLSLGGNNDVINELFLPRGSLVSDNPGCRRETRESFFTVYKMSLFPPTLRLGTISGCKAVQVSRANTLPACKWH